MSPPQSDERIAVIRPAAFPQTELIIGSDSTRSWRVFHERYVICAIRTGAAEWRYRGKTLSLFDESLTFVEPGESHFSIAHKPGEFVVLQMESSLVENIASELCRSGLPHFRTGPAHDTRLFKAIYGFSDAVSAGATILEQQSWLAACVRLFLEYSEHGIRALGESNASRGIVRAKAYIRDRFTSPVTLDDLSAVAGISRFHLVRQFANAPEPC
jgi:hypothetical protein